MGMGLQRARAAAKGTRLNQAQKHIEFSTFTFSGKKTSVFKVVNTRKHITIGYIRWHGAWRKYTFFPDADTLFDPDCLRMIAEKCEAETKAHMAGKRAGA